MKETLKFGDHINSIRGVIEEKNWNLKLTKIERIKGPNTKMK
jgi:hypothetical protein